MFRSPDNWFLLSKQPVSRPATWRGPESAPLLLGQWQNSHCVACELPSQNDSALRIHEAWSAQTFSPVYCSEQCAENSSQFEKNKTRDVAKSKSQAPTNKQMVKPEIADHQLSCRNSDFSELKVLFWKTALTTHHFCTESLTKTSFWAMSQNTCWEFTHCSCKAYFTVHFLIHYLWQCMQFLPVGRILYLLLFRR